LFITSYFDFIATGFDNKIFFWCL